MKLRYWNMDTVSPSIHRSVFPGLRVCLPMHCNTNVQVDQYKVALTFRLLCLQRQTEEDETINQSWVCVPGSSVVLTGGWNLFSYDDRFVEKCLNRTAKVKGRAEEQAGKSDYHWLMRKLYNTGGAIVEASSVNKFVAADSWSLFHIMILSEQKIGKNVILVKCDEFEVIFLDRGSFRYIWI